MIALVIQYKHSLGQFTSSDNPNNHFRVSLSGKNERDDQGNLTGNIIDVVESIDFWDFPEQQPTVESLKLLETDAGFLAWLSNRPITLERQRAKDRLDNEQRFLIKILIKELNALRTFNREMKTAIAAATSLADLKTRVALLNGMADRTLQQVKNAYDNET